MERLDPAAQDLGLAGVVRDLGDLEARRGQGRARAAAGEQLDARGGQARARSIRPRLSETLSRARRIGTTSSRCCVSPWLTRLRSDGRWRLPLRERAVGSRSPRTTSPTHGARVPGAVLRSSIMTPSGTKDERAAEALSGHHFGSSGLASLGSSGSGAGLSLVASAGVSVASAAGASRRGRLDALGRDVAEGQGLGVAEELRSRGAQLAKAHDHARSRCRSRSGHRSG